MSDAQVDDIIEVLSRASTGDRSARVDAAIADLDDPLSLIGNAINLLLDDLEYQQMRREEAVQKVAAARAKQEFLSYLSHDMQTPLAMLLGAVDLLDTSATSHDLDATLPLMRQAVGTLQRFVQQFLDLARLEADHPLPVRTAVTDVRAIVAAATGMFADREPIEVVLPERLPSVEADAARAEQIVANLLGNAYKYASEPSIVVSVDDDLGTVTVTIVDRGEGLSPEELDHVFGKFERGPVSQRAAGTGLGLFISRALAEAQGGALTADSTPGEGSRFSLRLPIAGRGHRGAAQG